MIKSIPDTVYACRSFFESGITRDTDFRKSALRRLRAAILSRQPEIAVALKIDLNKSEAETILTEVSMIISEIDINLKNLKRWSKPRRRKVPIICMPSQAFIVPQPYGTALVISPWNYPLQLALLPIVGAIAAGNCVVVRPSDDAPATAAIVEKIIAEAFESGHVAVVNGAKPLTLQLLDCRFDYIFFTGSPSFGHEVMAAAAKHLTPVTLELGGKSPCIVDSSADVNLAAKRIAWGKLINAGQTCVAPDYLFVHNNLKEVFVERYKYWVGEFYGSDPSQSTVYPKIINLRQAERLAALLADGDIIFGGESDTENRYIAPTLIENIRPGSPLITDEIFGPILPVMTFDDLSEPIAYINRGERPLALYFFGSRTDSRRVIAETASGGVCVNDTIMHLANPNLPFGGVGNSGMGAYHGRFSFETFTHRRALHVSPRKIDLPMRYPPYKFIGIIKKFLLK